jgi:hypothetical protein
MSVIIIPANNDPCDKTCVNSLIITFSSIFGGVIFLCLCCICIVNVDYSIRERTELNDQIIRNNVSNFISSNEPDTDLELYRKFNTYINQRQLKGCSFNNFCKIRKNFIEMV